MPNCVTPNIIKWGRVPELLINSEKRLLPLHLRKTQRYSYARCFQYSGTRPKIEERMKCLVESQSKMELIRNRSTSGISLKYLHSEVCLLSYNRTPSVSLHPFGSRQSLNPDLINYKLAFAFYWILYPLCHWFPSRGLYLLFFLQKEHIGFTKFYILNNANALEAIYRPESVCPFSATSVTPSRSAFIPFFQAYQSNFACQKSRPVQWFNICFFMAFLP